MAGKTKAAGTTTATPAAPPKTTEVARRVITPECRLSYPALFVPKAGMNAGDKAKFGAAFVFAAGTDLKALKAAALSAAQETFGEKAAQMIRDKKIRWPFREDGAAKGYGEGSTFINARSDQKPGVVSIFPDPNNNGKPTPITNPDDVYAGCYVKASLTAFYYDNVGGKGVTFALNNVQKIRDGERLDGRAAAADEFEADENAVASLDDLTAGNGGDDDDALAGVGTSGEDDISDLTGL